MPTYAKFNNVKFLLPRTQHTHDSSQTPLSVELMMTVNDFVSVERD